MAQIQEMSQKLANMIAAGEVIERPSNVVKEIVENSIDAKSHTISIYLANGGIKEIKVIDDGIGMDREDLELCFMPHATSKIKNEYDLARISSLGFRGEAIPSIASVSEMTISSNHDDKPYSITYKFGKRIKTGEVSHQRGTSVVVKNLFFNTPVRLKYLKSEHSELSSISYLIDKLALTHPDISFKLFNDDKLIFQSVGNGDMPTLIGNIYGLDAARKLESLDFEASGYNGSLYFVKPEIYRSNKLHMTYIINGRYVKNNALNDMFTKVFDQFLPINKYPIVVLYLNIDPLLIDVNVHPKKAEIRIAEERMLCDDLYKIFRARLEKTRQIPIRSISENSYYGNDEKPEAYSYLDRLDDIPTSSYSNTFSFSENVNDYNLNNKNTDYSLFNVDAVKEEEKSFKKLPELRFIGIVYKTYIICEGYDALYLIDQHAAAERIRYEMYAKEMENPKPLVTDLLVPLTIDFTKNEAMFVLDNLDKFKELGFYLEEISLNSFAIRSLPAWAADKEIDDIIRGLVNSMVKSNNISILPFRDSIAKQISCKSSIRANDKITEAEAMDLIRQLNECKNPYHCPHGRPTIIKFTTNDLKKMFERIQS